MGKKISFRQQFSNNLIAIISLLVAVAALTYNTWRSSTTELNRNYRSASFELIIQLAELQSITNDLHFNAPADNNAEWQRYFDKALIQGWGHIALIEDLSPLLSADFSQEAQKLKATWQQSHRQLSSSPAAEQDITERIQAMRTMTRQFIATLD
ncbi:hypothetical protein [Kangiella geojedonensis]|uniref:Uncharacterized protein n=1 Tax=Kangiella geojedonensis TaxID=914150 RepID=A0A0F6TQ56_9GAMM|nr:hypothetical protein [Kangiella geojedonensis]AKE51857.1 hypothetical protein TQ33_0888 [Kangiella geojedonensis]